MVKTFDLMKKTSFYEKNEREDLAELFDLSLEMKNLVYEIIRIIDFTYVNIEILEHILLKIDKHTQAFQDPIFKKFFFDNYENSILRHFLEHPGLLRVYFQMKFLQKKIMLFLRKIEISDKSSKISDKNFEISPKSSKSSQFKKIDLTSKDQKILNTEEEDGLTLKTKKNLEEISALLNIQNNFFKNHHENIFIEKGIHFTNYYNKKKLLEKAEKIYKKTHQIANKQEFLKTELRYDKNKNIKKPKPCYSILDTWLVIIHTFLYLTNFFSLQLTYIPYLESLFINDLLLLFVRICLPISVIISGFFFNWMTSSNKYRFSYFLSFCFLIFGNLCYFFAESLKNKRSLAVCVFLFGKFFLAFGGARLMTRKFIAINIEVWAQSHYAAIFVLMSALGQTFGPGIAAMIFFVGDFKVGVVRVTNFNFLAFVFFVIWILFFIIFMLYFKGYDLKTEINIEKIKYEEYLFDQRKGTLSAKKQKQVQKLSKKFTNRNFKIRSFKKPETDLKKLKFSKLQKNLIKKKKLPIFKAYFPNLPTILTLTNFILFKLYQEAYFQELPIMASHYFSHTKIFIGFFHLLSSLYAIPVALFALFFKKYPARYLLIFSFIIYIIAVLLKINYSYNRTQNIFQFYFGNVFLYSGSLMGEAATIAIMSKVISPTSKRGFVNAGFILGIGATFSRALGFWAFIVFFGFGVRTFSFFWYLTVLFFLVLFFWVTVLNLKNIQKFFIIKIFDEREDNRFDSKFRISDFTIGENEIKYLQDFENNDGFKKKKEHQINFSSLKVSIYSKRQNYKRSEDFKESILLEENEDYRDSIDFKESEDYGESELSRENNYFTENKYFNAIKDFKISKDFKTSKNFKMIKDFKINSDFKIRTDFKISKDFKTSKNFKIIKNFTKNEEETKDFCITDIKVNNGNNFISDEDSIFESKKNLPNKKKSN